MEDPFYSISSGVSSSWLQTLDWMCGAIQNRIDNVVRYTKGKEYRTPQLVCEQVKEKFGELRFYYHGGDENCEGMVNMAEHILWNTCANCGSHNNITTTTGWITRICDKCKK